MLECSWLFVSVDPRPGLRVDLRDVIQCLDGVFYSTARCDVIIRRNREFCLDFFNSVAHFIGFD